MDWVKVARASEIEDGRGTQVEVDGEDVGLFRVGGEYFATQNTCPHREGYLHEGMVRGETIVCPWHFATFCLRTGAVLEGPAEEGLKTYAVRVENGDVCVALVPTQAKTA